MTPVIITVFRSRLRPETRKDYDELSDGITALARSMPGLVDVKTFAAPDGERVTIVTFADATSHDAWRNHPDHQAAQARGVADFYEEYSIQVGAVTSSRTWHRRENPPAARSHLQ